MHECFRLVRYALHSTEMIHLSWLSSISKYGTLRTGIWVRAVPILEMFTRLVAVILCNYSTRRKIRDRCYGERGMDACSTRLSTGRRSPLYQAWRGCKALGGHNEKKDSLRPPSKFDKKVVFLLTRVVACRLMHQLIKHMINDPALDRRQSCMSHALMRRRPICNASLARFTF